MSASGPVVILLRRFDTGWLFVLAGCVMLACAIILPAADDVHEARISRAHALALEQHQRERFVRHTTFLNALVRQDETLVIDLAARSLNQAPASMTPVVSGRSSGVTRGDADVLSALDPPLQAPETREPPDTLLRRLVANPDTRLWVMGGALLSIVWGLLPPTTDRSPRLKPGPVEHDQDDPDQPGQDDAYEDDGESEEKEGDEVGEYDEEEYEDQTGEDDDDDLDA